MNGITFMRTLQSVLYDNMYDRYVSNKRAGKLNHKSLRKIAYSDKLFKKKEEKKNKNYSIALVVDCSGSMRGDKSDFAFQAAQDLSKHLASAKINHAVYGFNHSVDMIKPFNVKYDNMVKQRLEYMLHAQSVYYETMPNGKYKFLGKGLTLYPEVKKNPRPPSADMQKGGSGGNCDSTALRYAAKELEKEAGTKILIFLSDGEPAGLGDQFQSTAFPKEYFPGDYAENKTVLKSAVKHVIDSGIELHSIGIMSEAVNKFYPPNRTCSIYDINQLYDHIIKIIKLNLKRT